MLFKSFSGNCLSHRHSFLETKHSTNPRFHWNIQNSLMFCVRLLEILQISLVLVKPLNPLHTARSCSPSPLSLHRKRAVMMLRYFRAVIFAFNVASVKLRSGQIAECYRYAHSPKITSTGLPNFRGFAICSKQTHW